MRTLPTPSPATGAAPAPMDDARMRAGIRLRDPVALTAAYQAYWPRLFRQARLLLPASMDPEDMASTVFLHALERADEYDPAYPLYPWLARICARQCLNRRRRGWRRIRERLWRHRRPAAEAVVREGPPQAAREALQAALGRLGARQREVVALRYLFLLDEGQIATLLGVKRSMVATAICHGLARLRADDAEEGRLRGLWEMAYEGGDR